MTGVEYQRWVVCYEFLVFGRGDLGGVGGNHRRLFLDGNRFCGLPHIQHDVVAQSLVGCERYVPVHKLLEARVPSRKRVDAKRNERETVGAIRATQDGPL